MTLGDKSRASCSDYITRQTHIRKENYYPPLYECHCFKGISQNSTFLTAFSLSLSLLLGKSKILRVCCPICRHRQHTSSWLASADIFTILPICIHKTQLLDDEVIVVISVKILFLSCCFLCRHRDNKKAVIAVDAHGQAIRWLMGRSYSSKATAVVPAWFSSITRMSLAALGCFQRLTPESMTEWLWRNANRGGKTPLRNSFQCSLHLEKR